MKKLVTVICTITLTVVVCANEKKWQSFKRLTDFDSYQSSDYHLKEGVAALEIRSYGIRHNYTEGHVSVGIYVTPLKQLNEKLVKRFQKAKPDLSRKSDIRNPPDFKKNISRAFVITNKDEVFRMNAVSDVISFLGEIDRPAEAQLVWWMHSRYSGRKDTKQWKSAYSPGWRSGKYRKTSKGYEMMMTYTISRSYGRKIYEQCNDAQDFTDKVIVDKKGTIVDFRQVYKSKVRTECSNVTPYHHREVQNKDPLEVLNDEN